MPDDTQKPPQILVDTDWKSQAQAEKERLAEQEESLAEPKRGAMPKADLLSLVGMLGTQAVMYLGGMADRKTGAAIFDPEYAGHMIDLLSVLEEKTKGNLTPEEDSELQAVLRELRTRYVELSKLVASRAPGHGAAPASNPAG